MKNQAAGSISVLAPTDSTDEYVHRLNDYLHSWQWRAASDFNNFHIILCLTDY
jgi:hypothetical protein